MADRLTPEELALLDLAIAESMPSVQPPAKARDRVLHLIDELAKSPVGAKSIRHSSGVTGCLVAHDAERRTATILLQFAPGGVLAGHSHLGAEQAFVVSGSCHIGFRTFERGDFHTVRPGEAHGDIVSDDGCVLLVTADQIDLAGY